MESTIRVCCAVPLTSEILWSAWFQDVHAGMFAGQKRDYVPCVDVCRILRRWLVQSLLYLGIKDFLIYRIPVREHFLLVGMR